jgi:hypothetical protein
MIGTRTTPHSEPFSKTEKCVDYCIVDATQSLDLWSDVTFRFKVLSPTISMINPIGRLNNIKHSEPDVPT